MDSQGYSTYYIETNPYQIRSDERSLSQHYSTTTHLHPRHSSTSQLPLLLPPLPLPLRRPQQRIQTLQARHLHAPLARNPHGVPQNHLELQRLPGLPVQQHARPRALVARGALDDLVRARHARREGAAQDLGCRVEDLVHHAEEVQTELRVRDHVGVAAAAGEHGRGVHGGVDAELVPADGLQADLVVGLDVPDAAEVGPPALQGLGALGSSSGDGLIARSPAVRVGADADPRPAVLSDDSRGRLLGADDGDGTHDWGLGEALSEGLLNADAVLNENNA